MADEDPYRLLEYEELLGDLYSVSSTEMGLVALIGKISVILPEEVGIRLQGLIGMRVGVLRLGGFHIRIIDHDLRSDQSNASEEMLKTKEVCKNV